MDPAVNPSAPMLPAAYLTPGISSAQVWAAARYYRYWVLGSMLVCAIVAVVLSKFVLPKIYEATASLYVDFEVNDPVSGRDFPQMLATSYMSTQKALIESPSVLLPVIDKLGWVGRPEMSEGYVSARDGDLRHYLMSRVLGEQLQVAPYKDSRLINITWQGKNPAEVARAVNTVAEVYADVHLSRTLGPAEERAKQYSAQLDELRQKVDDAQDKVATFREENGLIDLDAKLDIEGQNLLGLSESLVALDDARRAAALRSSAYAKEQQKSGPSDTNMELLGNPYIQNLKTQLASQVAKLAEISKSLGPRHPQYVALEAEIAALRQQISKESAQFYNSVKTDSSRAAGGAAGAEAALKSQRKKVLETRRLQEKGASLLRDLETAKRLYDRALEGYETILRSSATKYTNVSVVSVAPVPTKPVKPKTKVNAILGLIAGGLLAMGFCLVWELTHRRVRCAEDLEHEMDAPVLAEMERVA